MGRYRYPSDSFHSVRVVRELPAGTSVVVPAECQGLLAPCFEARLFFVRLESISLLTCEVIITHYVRQPKIGWYVLSCMRLCNYMLEHIPRLLHVLFVLDML